ERDFASVSLLWLLLGAPLTLLETASSYSPDGFGPRRRSQECASALKSTVRLDSTAASVMRGSSVAAGQKERSPGRGRSGALVCRVSPRFWQIVMPGKVPRPPRFRQQPRIRKDARVTFLPNPARQRKCGRKAAHAIGILARFAISP